MTSRAGLLVAACCLLLAFGLIYVPAAGHGFIKDDFRWIAESTIRSRADLARLLDAPTGFFRPVVSLAFGINQAICDRTALCYGLTNVSLAVACACAIYMLARALMLPAAGALLAAALWSFNPHGINMAVLWISGRTALLVVLLSALTAAAFLRRSILLAIGLAFAAMLTKEEAVLLPVVLIGWTLTNRLVERAEPNGRRGSEAAFVIGFLAIAAIYAWLRMRSGAFTPATAPPFYQLSLDPARLVANGVSYLDRTSTFALALLAVWILGCRPKLRPLGPRTWRIVRFGAWWWVGTLAITVWLPVRSSLYACLPSAGVALAVAAVVAQTWPSTTEPAQRRAILAALVLPFALWPVYHARNQPMVKQAGLSAATLVELQRIASEKGPGRTVLLRDQRGTTPSFEGAFGTLAQGAADLMVTPPVSVWIDPPPADAALAGLQKRSSSFDTELTLGDGTVTRVR